MWSNTVKIAYSQRSFTKLHLFKKRLQLPEENRSISYNKFYLNKNSQYKKMDNLMYILGGGIGLAFVLSLMKNNRPINNANNFSFEKLLRSINVSAAVISPDMSGSTSPRAHFNFLADVVEKTSKSVVYIEITARHPITGKNFPISNGSGFIVKSNGLILTNAHVVNHYGSVIVKLHDGREFRGTVEDLDTESDLATVRIQAEDLPELILGRSTNLRPGEFVIAMGNPLTLSHTITAGVISSTNRQGKELGLHKKSDYIQTDAAVNVGNSGGPLVNLDGEAIGINTMKVTEGISFAIPSDRAVEFLKRTEEKRSGSWNPFKKTAEKKKHKYLGITMLTLSAAVIKDLKERNSDFPSVDHGVLIWRVMLGSPSYECGIRPGDVITTVNGEEIYSASDVQKYLEKEDVLHITVQRGYTKFKVVVELVEPLLP